MSFKTTQITGAVASGAGQQEATWRSLRFQQGCPEDKQNQILQKKKKKKEFFHVGLEN